MGQYFVQLYDVTKCALWNMQKHSNSCAKIRLLFMTGQMFLSSKLKIKLRPKERTCKPFFFLNTHQSRYSTSEYFKCILFATCKIKCPVSSTNKKIVVTAWMFSDNCLYSALLCFLFSRKQNIFSLLVEKLVYWFTAGHPWAILILFLGVRAKPQSGTLLPSLGFPSLQHHRKKNKKHPILFFF